MKEYIAETGGRYTYSDDIVNLQELALSMTAIFDGCANFIISGCLVTSTHDITPGYVWINGKVRYFEGCKNSKLPYYIYEHNSVDTVTYASDVNKRGRYNFLCSGSTEIPTSVDSVTNTLPGFIEITRTYAPRFIDKFFGKYGVLLDGPFTNQTIQKDLTLAGKLIAEKGMEAMQEITVSDNEKGGTLTSGIMEKGSAFISYQHTNGTKGQFIFDATGGFYVLHNGSQLIRSFIKDNGIPVNQLQGITQTPELYTNQLRLFQNGISNYSGDSNTASVDINPTGHVSQEYYRNFNVYNGKSSTVPIFQVVGQTNEVHVNGGLNVRNQQPVLALKNTEYTYDNPAFLSCLLWEDNKGKETGKAGYFRKTSELAFVNSVGGVYISTHNKAPVHLDAPVMIEGKSIGDIYVTISTHTKDLLKKVDKIDGKQLSTEDFTTTLKKKLEAISTGTLSGTSAGYVTGKVVFDSLAKKTDKASNLSDLSNIATARKNLDIYSKSESKGVFLQISQHLSELVALSEEETKDKSKEEIERLKSVKQETVRKTIDAEKKGTGDLKLAKSANLSDLPDVDKARHHISVYSIKEINELLAGKLSSDQKYPGVVFTAEHKKKLDAIQTGSFASGSVAQKEGYALISGVVAQLRGKANLLLDGYTDSEKTTIANNINVYSKAGADGRFCAISRLMDDYINYQTGQGKSKADAQKTLRDKINAPSKEDVSSVYLRKDGKLSDLSVPNADVRKAICSKIGAAYAPDYQTKLQDSGWKKMANYGTGTNTNRLYVRQIGNIVCIQGIINTANRNGSNWGGVVASIPNEISPPKYSVRTSTCTFNDSHKYNRGSSFIISGGTRQVRIYESGQYNADVEINFTYMI